jgi:hypothetical protein
LVFLVVITLFSASVGLGQEKTLQLDSITSLRRINFGERLKMDSLSMLAGDQSIKRLQKDDAVFDTLQLRIQSSIDVLKATYQLDSTMMSAIMELQLRIDSIKGAVMSTSNVNYQSPINLLGASLQRLQNLANQDQRFVDQNSAQQVEKISSKLEGITSSLKGDIPSLSPDILSANVTDLGNVSSGSITVPDIDLSLLELEMPSLDGTKSGEILEKMERIPEHPEMLMSRVEDFVEFDEVKAQLEEADKLKRYYDPDVAKEQAMNKAKLEAVNHFAGHEEELKAAMERLSQLKSKIPDPDGVIDLFARRQRTMTEKSFSQRLTPGLTIQLQKQRSVWVDLNPYVGIRITGRLTWGLGWNERFAFETQAPAWNKNERMFGPRTFLHYKLRQNLWLKGDFEKMNVARNADPELQTWVWSCFAGIKKDFKLSKRLSGNMQMLYGWHDPEYPNPYAERINVRIGFELPKLRNDNLPR